MRSVRAMVCGFVGAVISGLAGPAAAQLPVPIKDINVRADGGSISLGAELGGYLYYGACYQEDFFGCEPVRTPLDGSGVERLKDIVPGPDGSNPTDFIAVGNLVFFRANTNQLWKTDGTEAGTELVRGFASLPSAGNWPWAALGSQLFFRAESTSSAGRELWLTDGTTTSQISLCPGSCDGDPQHLTAAGGRLFFSAWDGSDSELWSWDGGVVSEIADLNPSGSSSPGPMAALGAQAIFQAYDGSELGLYVSDGVTTSKIAGSAQFFSGLEELVVVGGVAFFDATDAGIVSGRELWVSNGTPGGTGIVADIRPGAGSSDPDDLTAVGSSLFFTANDGISGRELWVSVGGGASTLPLELVPGPSGPPTLESIVDLNGGHAFFAADDGTGLGVEPWVSDGTPGGTHRVSDLEPGAGSGLSQRVIAAGGYAFFASSALNDGDQLWRSDGTAGGTVQLTQLGVGSSSSSIDEIVSFGGYGFFCADDGIHGDELWRTDGTTQGTILVQDLVPGPEWGCGGELTVVGGSLFFHGQDGSSYGLWVTNGQPGEAVFLKAFVQQPQQLTSHGGALFFVADDGGGAGAELWRSDGSTPGTVLVEDLYPGSLPASVEDLTSAGGALYFGGRYNDTGDFELWRSDGTAGGTAVLKDIRPGTNGSFPGDFGAVGSTVLFTADDGSHGRELWRTDGTPGGTVMVADLDPSGSGASSVGELVELGGYAYFAGDEGLAGRELWRTDGTSGGTARVADIRPGASGSYPRDLVRVGAKLYFTADDGTSGQEPWVTDGTTTERLRDVNPGGDASYARGFFATGNGDQAYFSAQDDLVGSQLWVSDGTPGGTTLLAALKPEGSGPSHFAFAGSQVVFTAGVGVSGTELWSFGQADCGDAPDPGYPTLVVDTGACHRVDPAGSTLRLGTARDADPDGQPSAAADGDDLDGGDDEDGVVFTSPLDLGTTATVDVTLSAQGYLNAWFDWDADGGWNELDDHVVFNRLLGAGTHELTVTVPPSAAVGETFARFRVDSAGTPLAGGILPDGEVEDYAVTLTQLTADLGIVKTAPATALPGTSLQYSIIASNPSGPASVSGVMVTDEFDSYLEGCTWTCTGSGGGVCTPSGAGDLEEAVELPAGGSVSVVVDCAIAADADGAVQSTAEVLPPDGVFDGNPANDFSEPTTALVPTGDLWITMTDGLEWVEPPADLVYTIEVQNPGPSDAYGVRMQDMFPAEVAIASWSCTPSGGGDCASSGNSDIDELVDLPAGAGVTFTALVSTDGEPGDTAVNTATVTAPPGFTDPDPDDNSATDITAYPLMTGLFEGGGFDGWSAVVGTTSDIVGDAESVPVPDAEANIAAR